MDQLTWIDTNFLTMESPRAYAHVGLVTIFDPVRPGHPLTTNDVRAVLEQRLHLMPPLRRRLAVVPLGIDRPYWFEDPDFDLDFHIRRTGIPSPGTDEQLSELISRIHARPLDRTRPLWELYVIEGLPEGRTAQYTKIHHAAIDAVTGADLMSVMLDTTPNPPPVEPPAVPWSPDRHPDPSEMFTRGLVALASRPRRAMRLARPLMSSFARSGAGQLPAMLQTAREVLERVPGVRDLPGMHRLATNDDDAVLRPGMTALRTSFNQRISQHRRFAFCSMDFDDVHLVKDAFGVNVNDVILAICAGALRAWLDDRRELPTDPLLALVPLSVRDASGDSRRVSRVAAVVTVLATQEADPVRRLGLIAAAAADARRSQNAVPASLLADVSQFTSPGLASLAARVVSSAGSDVANPPFNLVITNIPGPQQPLYCAGARQVATYSVPVINDGVGLNISAISYDGRVHVGAVACRELMPDLWGLVRRIPQALAELRELATTAGTGTVGHRRGSRSSSSASKQSSTRGPSPRSRSGATKKTTKKV